MYYARACINDVLHYGRIKRLVCCANLTGAENRFVQHEG
jgi:hypothetical protein